MAGYSLSVGRFELECYIPPNELENGDFVSVVYNDEVLYEGIIKSIDSHHLVLVNPLEEYMRMQGWLDAPSTAY
jgi:hypothetical protein